MRTAHETAETTAPRDPAAYRPRKRLAWTFLGAGLFGFVCLLAGIGLAKLWPKVLGHRPAATRDAAVEARRPQPLPAAAAPAPPIPAPAPQPPADDVRQLDARIAVLESQAQRTSRAAAAALAAAAVVEASQTSRPFAEELSALRAFTPPSPEIEALAQLAQAGAPSRAALAQSYPDYAARAAAAARTPREGADLGARILFAVSRVITLRRVGDVAGSSPDAVLARAERQVEDGDLDGALTTLDALPAGSRDALAAWRARAERRAEIDRMAAALRARALQDLGSARPAA